MVSGGEKQRVFVLETVSKAEIGALVASYHPALNNSIREADAPFRKVSGREGTDAIVSCDWMPRKILYLA